jgi:uncharacterized protein (UPF0297 family)
MKKRPDYNEVTPMNENNEATCRFSAKEETAAEVERVLREVCVALREKGYEPIDQIVGYLLSGDPAYITSHRNARVLIRSLERDRILEELARAYLLQVGIENTILE